jgi:MFS family permease
VNDLSTQAAPAWPRLGYARYVLGLLILGYAFGVLDRSLIAYLVTPIKADLGLSDTEMGLVQGAAFAILYTLLGLPVGLLVDRWRRVPVVWLGLALWSMATIGCGFAGSFAMLFMWRLLVGAGESTSWPGAASLIGDYFSPEHRAKAFGYYTMGGAIGVGMGNLLGAFAIDAAGDLQRALPSLLGGLREWQIVFMICGAPGLILAFVMWATMREPARRGAALQSTSISLRPLWAEMRTNSRVLSAIMLGAICNVLAVNAQLSWFPTLFVRVFDWKASQIAKMLALIGIPLGLFSAITAGWAIAWLTKRGRAEAPLLVIALQCGVWAVFGPLKSLASTPTLSLAGHVVTSLFATWALTATLTALNQVTPNRLRGQMIALFTVIYGLVAISLGSLSVGLFSDYVFDYPKGIAPSLAAVFAVIGTAGVVIALYGCGAYRAAVQRAQTWEEVRS